ncbi:MAG TPA: hypothetical protein DHW82_04680 [Spirochaetia bacterium]|nr:hypothetical protein [Spirochaetia bacterium]
MSGGLGKSFDVKAKQKKAQNIPINLIKTSEELQLEKEPIRVRITGQWFWKRVIVPPNAYVIHTRINKQKPVTLGLGISFRYKPNRDAYLIVPAAMQTIGVVANCISKEKQGINILAYVQWQIDDFSIAYKKLDFSDLRDPLGIVNAQLREQAEAAIKDKIATMSVEEVLTDKAPIIEELTARLKLVTEGSRKGNAGSAEGLGIKIATVQIREAIVCSTSLWDDLQSPFRHEQKKKSSISYLEMQNEIKEKELLTRKERETREAETNLEIELTKQKKLTETLELKMNEEASRYKKEQEVIQNKLKMEEQTVLSQKETEERLLSKENEMNQKRELEILRQNEIRQAEEERIRFEAEKRIKKLEIDQELFEAEEQNRLQENIHRMQMAQIELEKQIVEKQNDMELLKQNFTETIEKRKLEESLFRQKEEQKFKLFVEEEERKLEFVYEENMAKVEKIRQEIRNMMNSNDLLSQLIEELPQIAAKMPEIKELKVFQTNQSEPLLDSLTGFLQKIFSLSETMGIKLPFTPQEVKKNEKI